MSDREPQIMEEAYAAIARNERERRAQAATVPTTDEVRLAATTMGMATVSEARFDAWLAQIVAKTRESAVRDLTAAAEQAGEYAMFDGADFGAHAIPTYRLHDIAADVTDPKGA